MTVTRGPVIVCGADRSGLALLAELLDATTGIAFSRRTAFWTKIDGRFGDLADPANLERCLQAVMRLPHLAELDPDLDAIRAAFAGRTTVSSGDLFAALHGRRLERTGKTRWGDKSQGSEFFADRVFAELPGAKMIHLVRDPRDRYASAALHRNRPRGGAGSGAMIWAASMRAAEANAAAHPDRHLVVRYESLVEDPAATVGAVCAFLDEPAAAATAAAEATFTTASVGRFRADVARGDLAAGDIAVIQLLCRSGMRRHGYLPVPWATTPAGRLRVLAVDLPTNAVRLALWQGRRMLSGGDDELGRRRRAPRSQ